MKLEEGMYARTKYKKGIIKIETIFDDGVEIYVDDNGNEFEEKTGRKLIRYIANDGCNKPMDEEEITKASYDIKELIQYGDYVNGFKVIEFDGIDDDGNDYIELGIPVYEDACLDVISEYRPLSTIDIESIVTKEQFERMECRIGK